MRCHAIFLLVFCFLMPDYCAQAISDAEVLAAVQQGAELILKGQEAYDFAAETEAMKQARSAKKELTGIPGFRAGAEWPYQGVYRVSSGELPPGYRVGGSAIVALGLLSAPGFASDARRKKAVLACTEFILHELEHEPLMAEGFLGTYDVRGWGHAYALEWLLRAADAKVFDGALQERAHKLALKLVKTLEKTEIAESGGWNYARRGGDVPSPASTFMTAPTLQTLFLAQARGIAVRKDVIERALKTIEDARMDNTAFQYGTDPKRATGKGFEDVPGACARMAVCESTLLLAGRGSVERVRGAVKAFFTHWEWLEKRRKQNGTHIPPYMIAPYYFHYAHTYCAQAIELLPEAERSDLRQQLRALYWKTREQDGSWNDRVFERSKHYSTAMSILGLMAPTGPTVPRWQGTVAPAK
jgi:hypothetical protein